MNVPANSEPRARLRTNSLKEKLHSRKCVFGTFLEIPSPALVELLGLARFDFLVVDREHGPIDLKDTENLIRAGLSTDISILVRAPNCEATNLSQPLDWGAAGIHVPLVSSAEMARVIVGSSKYYPIGKRGLQPYVRAASYRAYDTPEYLAVNNADTVIVAQVEGREGIANLEAILQVEGVDVAFIGPYDLSQSLGIPGQVKHSQVREAMVRAIRLAEKNGKHIGTYCDNVETALEYRRLGVSYLTVSIDAYIFLSAARLMMSKLTS